MKNKLEVGMYIRTEEGIRKIVEEYDEGYELDRSLHFRYPEGHDLYKEDIDKDINEIILSEPSHNIIDLIQAGDYIRIITSTHFDFVYESYGKLVIRDDIDISKYTNKFIAEVITKEQMEQMSYKVGE